MTILRDRTTNDKPLKEKRTIPVLAADSLYRIIFINSDGLMFRMGKSHCTYKQHLSRVPCRVA